MEKDFLLNIHTLFVAIRYDIENPVNIKVLRTIKDNLEMGGLNGPFIKDMNTLYNLENSTWLSELIGRKTHINEKFEQNFKRIFNRILEKTIHMLEEKDFRPAYDVIDAFHWLPEAMAKEVKINFADFFADKVMPLSKNCGVSFVTELFDLLSVNRFTRVRLWLKIKKIL